MQLIVENIKVDLYNWAVPFIEESYISDGLRLDSLKDIAAFKLDVITTRKTKKDYYDLYFLLDKLSLDEMVSAYKEKYPYNSSKNVIVGLSSCSAADNDEQPELLKPVSWIEVKTMIINEVRQYEKNIIFQKGNQIKERGKILSNYYRIKKAERYNL